MAPAGPSPPRPAAGTPAGLTSWARGRGHRDSLGATALGPGAAPAPGAVGVDAAERPPERGEGGAAPEAAVAGAFLRPLSPQRPPRRARACPLRRAHAPKSTPGFGRGAEGLGWRAGLGCARGWQVTAGVEAPGFQLLISCVSVETDRG